MNFDKEAKSDKKKKWGKGGGGGGAKSDKKNLGEGGGALKPKLQTVSHEVNTKMQLSTQCRAVVQSTFQNTIISF